MDTWILLGVIGLGIYAMWRVWRDAYAVGYHHGYNDAWREAKDTSTEVFGALDAKDQAAR